MDSVEALGGIFAALSSALAAAPNYERRLLAQAIDDYAARFPDAFRNIRYGDAARILRELLDEVIEAVDAQRDSASSNLHG
jgi:hypothetical protein